MKTCFKCKAQKPLTNFYKHSMMADGYLNKCKSCAKADSTKHRNENIEKARAYDKERSKNPERQRAKVEVNRAWRAEDRRRARAHSIVSRAILNGELQRMVCERCGNPKSLAHHDDYDKPKDVMWLCQPCHKQRHKEILKEKSC